MDDLVYSTKYLFWVEELLVLLYALLFHQSFKLKACLRYFFAAFLIDEYCPFQIELPFAFLRLGLYLKDQSKKMPFFP